MTLRFIDLFAGIGGMRLGFEQACKCMGIPCTCVFTSEIKLAAVNVLKQNHPDETITGDITKVNAKDIPDFDFLLAGFPCQSFSTAGKRLGFGDTRGTMFFEVARIMKERRPDGFLLENVEGLVLHDRREKGDRIGKTFHVILETLEDLGYCVSWRVLNAKDFGLPQDRKRVYIAGSKTDAPDLEMFPRKTAVLGDILEHGQPLSDSPFIRKLLQRYRLPTLAGKSIKDKRGGEDNIHSWDLELKGKITEEQKRLMNAILHERRKKRWAQAYGIPWMDGMPLTISMIRTFYDAPNLPVLLEDLAEKGYLRKEHPKKLERGKRVPNENAPTGYNIVAGKMSFEVGKILDPNGIAPTLVAMDMGHLYVIDGGGIRPISLREGLRLFGYPETFRFDVPVKDGRNLLGNTVAVPVVKAVVERLIKKARI